MGCRGSYISTSSRTAHSTEQTSGQLSLHKDTLSWKEEKEIEGLKNETYSKRGNVFSQELGIHNPKSRCLQASNGRQKTFRPTEVQDSEHYQCLYSEKEFSHLTFGKKAFRNTCIVLYLHKCTEYSKMCDDNFNETKREWRERDDGESRGGKENEY